MSGRCSLPATSREDAHPISVPVNWVNARYANTGNREVIADKKHGLVGSAETVGLDFRR